VTVGRAQRPVSSPAGSIHKDLIKVWKYVGAGRIGRRTARSARDTIPPGEKEHPAIRGGSHDGSVAKRNTGI
jgi:hypothetical protein